MQQVYKRSKNLLLPYPAGQIGWSGFTKVCESASLHIAAVGK
jgi:hypothetical protein